MDTKISEDFSGSNDQMIVKRKRTKWLKPPFFATSSGCGSGGVGGELNYNSLVSSPAVSSGISSSTEEDDDIANCLILLARGGFSPQSAKEIKLPEDKLSSRKFTKMATTTTEKAGIFVYECNTCSRSFPSFQALGGHRASHKKPKPAGTVDWRKSPPAADEEEGGVKFTKLNAVTPSISSQSRKIHECSICGSEFTSGQALGGHMRRHRSAFSGATVKIGTGGDDFSLLDLGDQKSRNMLELDLNLPAEPEDDCCDTEFHQFPSSQQPRLVFSAATLVDCHY